MDRGAGRATVRLMNLLEGGRLAPTSQKLTLALTAPYLKVRLSNLPLAGQGRGGTLKKPEGGTKVTKKITDMSMEEIDALSDDEFVAAARGGGVVPTTREREADLAAAPSDLAMVNKMRELRGQEPLGEQERASLSTRFGGADEVSEEFFDDAYYIAHDSQLGYYRQEHRRGHVIPPEYEAALRQRRLL